MQGRALLADFYRCSKWTHNWSKLSQENSEMYKLSDFFFPYSIYILELNLISF